MVNILDKTIKKVAVLLAAYNGENYISEQIDSIIKQKSVDIDIYISVDKSTDNTLCLINKLIKENNNIYLLEYGNSYGSAGQNFFRLLTNVDFEKYDYISFSDQDDIWLENKIFSAIKKMKKGNHQGYSSNVIAFWSNGENLLINKSEPQTEYDYLFESAGPGCTFVMTKNLANSIKECLLKKDFEIKNLWLHDWFCYAFARGNGFSWYIDSDAYMLYRQHDSNSIGANSGLKSFFVRVKSVVSGDAFTKVLNLANFLDLEKKLPISLLKEKSFIKKFRLLYLSNKCRRRKIDKIYFFFSIIIYIFKKDR